jgi:hypothetical protein
LIEFQKIISALLVGDFAGLLVREFLAGVFFFAIGFFDEGVSVGFAMTAPPLPCGAPVEAFGFNEGIIKSSTAANENTKVSSRILTLKQPLLLLFRFN